jgi:hypothetical protein
VLRTVLTADPDTEVTFGDTNIAAHYRGNGVRLGNSVSSTLGFYGATGTNKPTISSATGLNEALTDLLAALDAQGLIVDNSTP